MTMVDNGRPWSPRYLVVDHGSSWATVKYRGDDHGQVACDHGRPRSITVDHGQSSTKLHLTMVNHGRPWSIVDQITYDHGQSRSTMVNHGRPWSITVDHGQSRSTMVNHGRQWSITVDHVPIVCDRGRPWSSHMTMFFSIYYR